MESRFFTQQHFRTQHQEGHGEQIPEGTVELSKPRHLLFVLVLLKRIQVVNMRYRGDGTSLQCRRHAADMVLSLLKSQSDRRRLQCLISNRKSYFLLKSVVTQF